MQPPIDWGLNQAERRNCTSYSHIRFPGTRAIYLFSEIENIAMPKTKRIQKNIRASLCGLSTGPIVGPPGR